MGYGNQTKYQKRKRRKYSMDGCLSRWRSCCVSGLIVAVVLEGLVYL